MPAGGGVIALVVFDLDGTLIDSRRDLADAVNALLADHGAGALGLDQITGMVGEGAAALVRRALSAAALDPDTPGALASFLEHYDARLTRHTKPYPGMPETLAALRADGTTLAVLTNKPQRQTLDILERLELASAFAHVVGGDTSAGRKPDPTGLLDIVAGSGAAAGTTMLVGDSPIDLATARLAGTRICLARYGFGYRFEPGAFRGDELFVDAPGEIVAVMRQI